LEGFKVRNYWGTEEGGHKRSKGKGRPGGSNQEEGLKEGRLKALKGGALFRKNRGWEA